MGGDKEKKKQENGSQREKETRSGEKDVRGDV